MLLYLEGDLMINSQQLSQRDGLGCLANRTASYQNPYFFEVALDGSAHDDLKALISFVSF